MLIEIIRIGLELFQIVLVLVLISLYIGSALFHSLHQFETILFLFLSILNSNSGYYLTENVNNLTENVKSLTVNVEFKTK